MGMEGRISLKKLKNRHKNGKKGAHKSSEFSYGWVPNVTSALLPKIHPRKLDQKNENAFCCPCWDPNGLKIGI